MKRLVFFLCLVLWATLWTIESAWADETYVTVYGSNLGLVRQIRTIESPSEERMLRIDDVAAGIIPESVQLRPLKQNSAFKILEQTFQYDLADPERVLEKTVGKFIEFLTGDGDYVQGLLLNKYDHSFLVQTEDGIRIIPRNDELSINVQRLPEGLVIRPTLEWKVVGLDEGPHPFEITYLTKGLNWDAAYVGILNEDSTKMQMDAWASIRNESGTNFTDARFKLVAGDVKRALERYPQGRVMKRANVMSAAEYDGAPSVEQRELFEYYVYELGQAVTLPDRVSKLIPLRGQVTVKTEKQFVYNQRRQAEGVEVLVSFRNDQANGLGEPLPAGVFRVYQRDKDGLVFLGEQHIEHTAREKEVKIAVGNAFDLSGERKIIESRRISDRSERQSVAIELRNSQRKKDAVVIVEEIFDYRNWKIEDHSHAFEKKDARQVDFAVPVAAESVTTLRYTVLYSW